MRRHQECHDGISRFHQHLQEGNHKYYLIVIGIDLAKTIFVVHGVDEYGKAELVKPRISREQLLPLIVQLPPCQIVSR